MAHRIGRLLGLTMGTALIASAGIAGSPTMSKMEPTVIEPPVPAAAEAPAPRFNWDGAYAGAGLSYGRMNIRGSDNGDGLAGNLFAGYRFGMGGAVFGVEGQIVPSLGSTTLANGDDVELGGSLLLSAGLPLTADQRTLGYVSAGPTALRTSGPGGSDTSIGATVGLGVDYAVTDQIILRSGVSYSAINNVGNDDLRTRTTAASVGVGFRF